VCDRVTVLDRGRLAAEGRLDDLLNIAGRTSVRAGDLPDGLPEPVRGMTDDVAFASGMWVFSVPDAQVRAAVDALDDAGGRVLALAPKRESLEDYFSRLLEQSPGGGEAS
jgi:ABC-type multidrug transport system ATPase subunit